MKFGEAWRPVEDEFYEPEEKADCDEATAEEKDEALETDMSSVEEQEELQAIY